MIYSVIKMKILILLILVLSCSPKYTVYKPLYSDWKIQHPTSRIVDSTEYFYEVKYEK